MSCYEMGVEFDSERMRRMVHLFCGRKRSRLFVKFNRSIRQFNDKIHDADKRTDYNSLVDSFA